MRAWKLEPGHRNVCEATQQTPDSLCNQYRGTDGFGLCRCFGSVPGEPAAVGQRIYLTYHPSTHHPFRPLAMAPLRPTFLALLAFAAGELTDERDRGTLTFLGKNAAEIT